MLTGDKVGTAKNIAAACSLLPAITARNFSNSLSSPHPPHNAQLLRQPSFANKGRVIEWTTETIGGLDDVPANEIASAVSARESMVVEVKARARWPMLGRCTSYLTVRFSRKRDDKERERERERVAPAASAAGRLIGALEQKFPALASLSEQCLAAADELDVLLKRPPSNVTGAVAASSAAVGKAAAKRVDTRRARPSLRIPGAEASAEATARALDFALVVDEKTIDWLTAACPAQFAALTLRARAVIACRCRQEQKAQMVRLVREHSANARVLAIGDGANDVAMIRAAHVGVGIAGKEGMQAVQNADFAIGQFRFLRRLLFVHGRHNYRRLSILVCYMFYKNVLDRMTQFQFTTGAFYSGQKFWSEVVTTIFNVVFTSLPIIAIACADADLPARVAERAPELYRACAKQLLYTHSLFWSWVLEACCVSIAYFLAIKALYRTADRWSGSTLGVWEMGIVSQVTITTMVNFRLMLDVTHWTAPIVFIFAATLVVWVGSIALFSGTFFFFWAEWWGVPRRVLLTGPFCLFFIWAMVIGLLPKLIRETVGGFFPSEDRLALQAVRAQRPPGPPRQMPALLRRMLGNQKEPQGGAQRS
mmetsp:Transcript_22975/g.54396  ORF Transcript_22975/g.54396 Transcript_22975/m.54396 type:complete len:594 (-) Transcript_22975:186-1967(-)